MNGVAAKTGNLVKEPMSRRPPPDGLVGDLRFRMLLGNDDWQRLPSATRKRFSERLGNGRTVTYSGITKITHMSPLGWTLAQLARLIGAPLPLSCAPNMPAVVSVTEDETRGGQYWSRVYGRKGRPPQVIHSSKCFNGPTGLEEHIGFGFGISLKVSVADGALHFDSAGYFLNLLGARISLNALLGGLNLRVSHIDQGGGRFIFALRLRHRLLGEMIRQEGLYADMRTEKELPE